MSDASDEIQVDAPVEVEAPVEAPKGKLSVEEALQVSIDAPQSSKTAFLT